MNRFQIAQYIALGATVLSILGIVISFMTEVEIGDWLLEAGIAAGIVSYLFAGLLTAIKMAAGIAKWGWLIIPFPFDIATFVLAFLYACIVFLLLPIIPVRKAYNENAKYSG